MDELEDFLGTDPNLDKKEMHNKWCNRQRELDAKEPEYRVSAEDLLVVFECIVKKEATKRNGERKRSKPIRKPLSMPKKNKKSSPRRKQRAKEKRSKRGTFPLTKM